MTNGTCRFCGKEGTGQEFGAWVKDTFTNYDRLLPGEVICDDCLFWFNQASQSLADKTGKDKLQKMQNYTHVIKNSEWFPLSKGDKARMIELLLTPPFPELAAIADSGQKHIAFRARRNPAGQSAGWVQFEEQQIWVNPAKLKYLIDAIENALVVFSKSELGSGRYLPHRVLEFGLPAWQTVEDIIKPRRDSLLFKLALFLGQRKESNERDSGGFTGNSVARDRERIQEPIPANDLGTVREHGEGGELHEQPGEVHQLTLF